jgi:DNA gyrase subunit A
MRTSFLEYAYSVIYSRALPDARDGLKPVQRRILHQMTAMGLRPDRGHVKSARVVGEVMGRLHPHGDSAIYDALVRLTQPFSMRVPFVDGHGNFGSPDDGPAAMRYTECRLAPAALAMTADLDEDVVDLVPNYDGRETEPSVLPAAIPALLVNGVAGIAVGMATNIPPHNLAEVVSAARHLLAHPEADVADLERFIPGPDLPTGGAILGLDGIREAYRTGRGSFRIRARAKVEQVTARRSGIAVTELPFGVGAEKVIERIADLVRSRKLEGIAYVSDLSDGEHGLRIVIEIKSGFVPEAVLDALYRMTPLEESFSVNAVALVNGEPRTLSLRDMISVFVEHRLEVTLRRTHFRRRRAADRLHIVEGLLTALVDIDEVIEVIRGSDDASAARERLMSVFDLSEIQANYILDMPLRRLTRFSRIELETERENLVASIADLDAIVGSDARLRSVVSDELGAVAERFASPRRTVLLDAPITRAADPMEVPDLPCRVLLTTSGLIARIPLDPPAPATGRAPHDAIVSMVPATNRGHVGLLTSLGRVHRLDCIEIPGLAVASPVSAAGGVPLAALIDLADDERPVALVPAEPADLVLATATGVIKRVGGESFPSRSPWDVIRLAPYDHVVGAAALTPGDVRDCLLVTSDAQALRFDLASLRAQGRGASGVAGIRCSAGAEVVALALIEPTDVLLTVSGSGDALPGTQAGAAKVTAVAEIPTKGRGTGGVRCHRFLSGEDRLIAAWAGPPPARVATPAGQPLTIADDLRPRDGSGRPITGPLGGIGGSAG